MKSTRNGCRSWSTICLESTCSAASPQRVPAYLVGGAVRDLLLGVDDGPDLDVAIEGEVEALSDVPGFELERDGTLPDRPARARRHQGRRRPGASRELPAARRPAGGTPGDHRGGPRPPRLHGQRDGLPARRRSSGADRPARRCRRPAGGPPSGAARALLRRRPHPGAAGGALRRAASASSSSPARRSCSSGPIYPASRTTASRPSCAGSPPRTIRRRALRLIVDWGVMPALDPAAPDRVAEVARLGFESALVRLGGPGAGRDARHHEATAPDPRARRRDPGAAVGDRPPGRTLGPGPAAGGPRARRGMARPLCRRVQDGAARDHRRGPDRGGDPGGPRDRPRPRRPPSPACSTARSRAAKRSSASRSPPPGARSPRTSGV